MSAKARKAASTATTVRCAVYSQTNLAYLDSLSALSGDDCVTKGPVKHRAASLHRHSCEIVVTRRESIARWRRSQVGAEVAVSRGR